MANTCARSSTPCGHLSISSGLLTYDDRLVITVGIEVLSAITAEERTVKSLDLDKLLIERALRLQWDTKTDTFGVKVAL